MIARFVFWLSGHLPCRVITGAKGEPYLERYYLFRVLGVTFYLHRFVADDPDRGLHDHPWGWSCSLVLAGGYHERRAFNLDEPQPYLSTRTVRPWQFNVIRGDDWHRILLIRDHGKPIHAWSLFAHGPRRKGWGFVNYRGGEYGNGYITLGDFRPYTYDRASLTDRWPRNVPVGNGHPQRQPLQLLEVVK